MNFIASVWDDKIKPIQIDLMGAHREEEREREWRKKQTTISDFFLSKRLLSKNTFYRYCLYCNSVNDILYAISTRTDMSWLWRFYCASSWNIYTYMRLAFTIGPVMHINWWIILLLLLLSFVFRVSHFLSLCKRVYY